MKKISETIEKRILCEKKIHKPFIKLNIIDLNKR